VSVLDLRPCLSNVCFTPESRLSRVRRPGPLRARSTLSWSFYHFVGARPWVKTELRPVVSRSALAPSCRYGFATRFQNALSLRTHHAPNCPPCIRAPEVPLSSKLFWLIVFRDSSSTDAIRNYLSASGFLYSHRKYCRRPPMPIRPKCTCGVSIRPPEVTVPRSLLTFLDGLGGLAAF
jgi:hypothetical protein